MLTEFETLLHCCILLTYATGLSEPYDMWRMQQASLSLMTCDVCNRPLWALWHVTYATGLFEPYDMWRMQQASLSLMTCDVCNRPLWALWHVTYATGLSEPYDMWRRIIISLNWGEKLQQYGGPYFIIAIRSWTGGFHPTRGMSWIPLL
jgi:hypothetical protein